MIFPLGPGLGTSVFFPPILSILWQVLTRRQQLATTAKENENEKQDKDKRGKGAGKRKKGTEEKEGTREAGVTEVKPKRRKTKGEKEEKKEDDSKENPNKKEQIVEASGSKRKHDDKDKPLKKAKTGKEAESSQLEAPEGKEDGDKDKKRGPSDKQKQAAKVLLSALRSDPRKWGCVQKLYEACSEEVNAGNVMRFEHYTLSVYWTTKRVGLLAKQEVGKPKHILSFGNPFSPAISLPLCGVSLYVHLLVFREWLLEVGGFIFCFGRHT